MKSEQFISALRNFRKSSTFLTLRGYRNNYGEVSDYNLIFNVNYTKALQKSISILKGLKTKTVMEF